MPDRGYVEQVLEDRELEATHRHFVAIDEDPNKLHEYREKNPGFLSLHADASDDDVLQLAGIQDANGVFAVTGDDSRNLMIVITARQLNPAIRIVARCHETRNIEKMRKAGADDSTLNGKVLDLAIREAVDGLVKGIEAGAWRPSWPPNSTSPATKSSITTPTLSLAMAA